MSESAQGRSQRLGLVAGEGLDELREELEVAGRRLEILARQERAQAESIRALRAELRSAHALSLERDEAIRRDVAELVRQRDDLAARLDRLRKSWPGRALRAAKRLKAKLGR